MEVLVIFYREGTLAYLSPSEENFYFACSNTIDILEVRGPYLIDSPRKAGTVTFDIIFNSTMNPCVDPLVQIDPAGPAGPQDCGRGRWSSYRHNDVYTVSNSLPINADTGDGIADLIVSQARNARGMVMNEIRPHSFLIHINDENLILYVDSNNATGIEDGSEDYPYNTITEAVEAATSVPRGHIDEIHVHPGLYSAARGEDTNPRARVALKGGGASNTIIEGLIELTVEDEFSGFTGRNTRWLNVCLDTVIHHNVFYTSCIIVDDPYGIQIINNTIVDCDNGISIAGPAEESIIKNNIFAFNNTALSLYDSESIGTFDITYNDFWEN